MARAAAAARRSAGRRAAASTAPTPPPSPRAPRPRPARSRAPPALARQHRPILYRRRTACGPSRRRPCPQTWRATHRATATRSGAAPPPPAVPASL
eukprot:4634410-Prymnesium_polylepis.1